MSDIATFGSALDRRYLFDRLDGLRTAIDAQAALSLQDAVAEYVGLVSSQHGERLKVLLARTGLNGQDRVTGAAAGERLGVSFQRIYQLEHQLEVARNRATPPAGIWMPQLDTVDSSGRPDGYTISGVEVIRGFFDR